MSKEHGTAFSAGCGSCDAARSGSAASKDGGMDKVFVHVRGAVGHKGPMAAGARPRRQKEG